MKREVYYNEDKIDKFDDILSKYGKNEFKSPYRSTIPLIILFKSEIWNNFGLVNNSNKESFKYFFESETNPIKGIGRASCTDLMIESNDICIAVEAKRTEPPYATVKKWLANSVNKKLVLEGWLEMIEKQTDILISVKDISDLPYQLIHRVASACSKGKIKTHVIYLGFNLDKTKKEYYLKNIDSFSKLLNKSIDLHLICIDIEKTAKQENLESLWNLGNRDLSIDVKNGIKNNALMTFCIL